MHDASWQQDFGEPGSSAYHGPKGELHRKTAASLAAAGYRVEVLNFRDPRRGSRWNPFGVIQDLYRSGDMVKRSKAQMMLNDVMDILRSMNESSRDPFWTIAAVSVITGTALAMLG